MKHLKMKREAFLVSELAISKQGPIASTFIRSCDRNTLLKVRLTLFSELIRAEARQLKLKKGGRNVRVQARVAPNTATAVPKK